jgi:cell division protein FtsQ
MGVHPGSGMIRRIRPNRRCDLNARPRHGWKTVLARILVALTVLVAGAGAGWYGWQRVEPGLLAWADRVFVIRYVDLTETRRVSRDQVLALLDLPAERGLLQTDTAALQRVLETHPWIRSAAVRRVFPDTLAVDVQEREPVAILRTGGPDFLVDYEGVLLMKHPPRHDESLPVLKGVDYVEAVLREPWTAKRLQTGIALAALLGQAVGRPPVVDLGTPGDFVAYDAGFRLRFGEGQFGDKVDRYRQVSDRVLDRWGDRKRTTRVRKVEVDLRFQDKVIVRERK